nr:uncharacterized protein LOC126054567 [Helicoverpa armigera]
MMGIRTPVKRATSNPPNRSPPKAGPSQHSVRRSVGEWEAGLEEQRKSVSPSKINEPKQGAKPSTLTRGTVMTIPLDSPPVPHTNVRNPRTAEAKRCVTKVMQQMALSKNIKREIKEDVTIQVQRLFSLVKEAEADGGRAPSVWTQDSVAVPSPPPCSVTMETEMQSLKKVMEEHSKKLAESNGMMDRLKEALRSSQDSIEKISYASVAASQSGNPLPRQTALHSIAVTTEDESKTGEEVITKIREAVNAKEEWITVEKVRKTKNRKVIMSFGTKEERDKVKERLKKNGTDLTVEEVKNKDPLLILRDVLLANTDEDVLKALRNQNPSIFHGLDGEADRLEVKYRKKARNPHTGHIVLSTSPSIWRRVTERGYVYIDLQRIRAEDQSPLLQCSLCLGYGHSRRICTETVEKCSHCGGPHLRNDCPDWLAGEYSSMRHRYSC